MKGWKPGIVALISLAALVSAELVGSAHAPANDGRSEIECNYRDPLSPCAADFDLEYPIGDGLAITLDFLGN
jgi:hypothetical protein